MNMMSKIKYAVLIIFFLFSGCSGSELEVMTGEPPPSVTVPDDLNEPDEEVLSTEDEEEPDVYEVFEEIDYDEIQPYEVGQIMIVMYHGISQGEPESVWQRSIVDFRNDLQRLYDGGYRLISMKDLLNNNIRVEAGYTPVVFTFDDSLSSAFSLIRNESGELEPSPDCAVGIMNEFAKEYPDFGNTATFYIIGGMDIFKGEGTIKERFEYLVSMGHDVGNHTYSHNSLKNMSEIEIQEEMAKTDKLIKDNLPDYIPTSLSYPLGERPIVELRSLVLEGESDGHAYEYFGALAVGQSGASATPNRNGYDPLNLPRARGTDSVETDFGWYFDYYEKNPEARYVSDGNPNRISVPAEYSHNVNMESLNEKELFIYGGDS